jgi:hypothetical protein
MERLRSMPPPTQTVSYTNSERRNFGPGFSIPLKSTTAPETPPEKNEPLEEWL